MTDGRLYLISEIAAASGISAQELQKRRQALRIPAGKGGYTYEEARRMILHRPTRRKKDPTRVNRLRVQLQNDGIGGNERVAIRKEKE